MKRMMGGCLGILVVLMLTTNAMAAPADASNTKKPKVASLDLPQSGNGLVAQASSGKDVKATSKLKKKVEAKKKGKGWKPCLLNTTECLRRQQRSFSFMSWRRKVPWMPFIGYRAGFSVRPRYFAPENAFFSPTVKTSENPNEVDGTVLRPFITQSYALSLRMTLRNFGVKGYMSDLGLCLSWGFRQNITGNAGSAMYANQVYANDIGVSLRKMLFREKYTGIILFASLGSRIPVSLPSQQRTLITSLSPRIAVSKGFRLFKTVLTNLSLSYSFGANFNFYQQDSGLYNPDLQGIPRLNQAWGMSHSVGLGLGIIRGLSLSFGLSISSGYSFADQYATNTGPQVFGNQQLSAAELASFPMNEGNGYGISIGLSYSILGIVSVSVGYSNFGGQFEYQFDQNGQRQWVLRNPFKLQNGGFSVGLGGRI